MFTHCQASLYKISATPCHTTFPIQTWLSAENSNLRVPPTFQQPLLLWVGFHSNIQLWGKFFCILEFYAAYQLISLEFLDREDSKNVLDFGICPSFGRNCTCLCPFNIILCYDENKLILNSSGFPESDIKTFLDPKNEIVYNVQDNGDGSFEVASTLSLMPAWNTQNSMKVWSERDAVLIKHYKYVSIGWRNKGIYHPFSLHNLHQQEIK